MKRRPATTIDAAPIADAIDDAPGSGRPAAAALLSTLPVMIVAVGVRLLVSLFGYVLQVLVSRSATTAQYGRYAFASSVALAFSGLAPRGSDQLVLQQAPRFVFASPVFLSGLRRFVVRRTLVGFAIAVPVSIVVLTLGDTPDALGTYLLYASLTVATVIVGSFGTLENAWLSAHGRPLLADTLTFLATAVLSCAVFLVISIGLDRHSGEMALLSVLLGTAMAVAIIHLCCRWTTRGFEAADPGELSERHWRRVANKFFMVALCQAASGRSIVLALGFALDPTQFALLFAAWKMAQLLDVPHMAIGSWAAPRFAAARDARSMQPLLTTISQFMAVISVVLGVALIVFRDPILGVFGDEYRGVARAFVVLVVGRSVVQQLGPVGYLLGVMGSERSMLRIEAGVAIFGVPFATLLAWRFGVNGAAIGIVVSLVVRTVAMWWSLGRRHSLWGLPIRIEAR
jgi:O-antigen/teichoic acid export membrane protein